MHGPTPKPPSKRRRVNKPVSYGAATPIAASAAARTQDRELGIDDPHPMVVRMWEIVQESCESRFYSEADWARLRLELWHANALLVSDKPIGANSWAAVQHGLNALLISPAEKRRCGIDVRPTGGDPDEGAAVSMMSGYKAKLTSVKTE